METAVPDLAALGVRLIVRAEAALTTEERAASEALRDRTWPSVPDYRADPDYRNPPVIRALSYEATSGDLIGTAVGLDCRLIVAEQEARPVAGLGGVVVEPAWRGRGLGAAIVRATMAAAREAGYDFGALFSRRERGPFYERLGWHAMSGPIVKTLFGVEQPIRPGGLFMVAPLTPAALAELPSWRTARIHVGVGQW